ncbi:hypothetical protein ALC57_06035, partial [Trachymyrmex cornetzi]
SKSMSLNRKIKAHESNDVRGEVRRRKVSASSVDSLHEQGRRTVRRHRCRRLRRIDSSKGNSYPLTGRNSLRGEILNRTGVSRPPTLLEINACPSQ